MIAILNFAQFFVNAILQLLLLAIIINAVLSWLVAFDVVNLRNRLAYTVAHFLDSVTRPILRPFQRIIPPLGGIDISPIIVLLLIQGARGFLVPAFFDFLRGLLG